MLKLNDQQHSCDYHYMLLFLHSLGVVTNSWLEVGRQVGPAFRARTSAVDALLETLQTEGVLAGQDTWLFELRQANCTTNAKPLQRKNITRDYIKEI